MKISRDADGLRFVGECDPAIGFLAVDVHCVRCGRRIDPHVGARDVSFGCSGCGAKVRRFWSEAEMHVYLAEQWGHLRRACTHPSVTLHASSSGRGMTTPPHILSVGTNPTLMSSRSLILRGAGYLVDEAYTVDRAISLVEADSIGAILLCHTIPRDEQKLLISAVREKRRLTPILSIRSYAYETPPPTCVAVDNDPEALLKTLRLATAPKRLDP